MVMNIFDAEFKSSSLKESEQTFNNKETYPFDYMFNTNSFFGNNSDDTANSYDPFKDKHLNSNLPNFDSSFLANGSPSEPSYFTNHGTLFEDHQPQPWSQQWSNGESKDSYTYHSLPSSACNFALPNNQNSSPGQSRIMSYINNNTPPISTPPLSISPTQNIESMKVRDFLNHTSGSLNHLEASSLPNQSLSNGKDEKGFQKDRSESFFTDFYSPAFQSMSLDDRKKPSNESNESDNQSINVWDSLNSINSRVNLAPNAPVKNAWSKPLKFSESKASNSAANKPNKTSVPQPGSHTTESVTATNTQQPSASIVTACVGKKISELDDFDTSAPTRTSNNVRPGGFQVVCSKKSKSNKANPKPAQPPTGVEKCSYGGRCLFGTECSRWHSLDDHEEFNKQKMPNGNRKCPWGAKCFRKLKCINHHSKEELEQFKL